MNGYYGLSLVIGLSILSYICNMQPIPLENPHAPYFMEIDDWIGIRNDSGCAPEYSLRAIDGKYVPYDVNSYDDPINPYNRNKQIYDIKSLIDDIQGIKKIKCIFKGYYWNTWRNTLVQQRTNESADFDTYLNEIESNLDNYSTLTLLNIKRELLRFFKGL